MTIEENQELKEKLRKLGYDIRLFPNPLEWAARVCLDEVIDGGNLTVTIVDSSYENMDYIKIRTRIHGTFDSVAERLSMKECSVDYVLSLVGPANVQIKMMLNRERLEKINEDF